MGCHADVYGLIILSTAVTITIQIKEFLAFADALIIVTIIMVRLYLPAATRVKHFVRPQLVHSWASPLRCSRA
jgi:hypothetical protein